MEQWIRIALEEGFTYAKELKMDTIELLPEVRKMCENNTCRAYGKNWACPPACGTLEECGERLKGYSRGILLQTVGEIEDWMDFEGMMEAEKNIRKPLTVLWVGCGIRNRMRCRWEPADAVSALSVPTPTNPAASRKKALRPWKHTEWKSTGSVRITD